MYDASTDPSETGRQDAAVPPLLSFADAATLPAPEVVGRWLDHHGRATAALKAEEVDRELDRLAVTAAAQVALSREQAPAMHAALLAGGELIDVAEAAGLTAEDVVTRWRRHVRRMRRAGELDQAAEARIAEVEARLTEQLADLS
ncbi:hypothetical protein [Actinomadura hibisca]|uniref:hypothetical protein n=1 Tax=Actinomadura hibisca TaxID=68565 RepID=UPI0008362D4E|nr:hypothetical protein [Actinomadura hibisca]